MGKGRRRQKDTDKKRDKRVTDRRSSKYKPKHLNKETHQETETLRETEREIEKDTKPEPFRGIQRDSKLKGGKELEVERGYTGHGKEVCWRSPLSSAGRSARTVCK